MEGLTMEAWKHHDTCIYTTEHSYFVAACVDVETAQQIVAEHNARVNQSPLVEQSPTLQEHIEKRFRADGWTVEYSKRLAKIAVEEMERMGLK
jgi:hypothetical protein